MTSEHTKCATQGHVGCLVVNLTCGVHAKGMVREVENLLSHNGPEWVCSRMKAMWNAALHLKNGDPDKARAVYQENSIAYHHGTLLPKGEWGYPVHKFVEAKKASVIRKYAAVLRFYCSLSLEHQPASKKQARKALLSIGKRSENHVPEQVQDELILGSLAPRMNADGITVRDLSRRIVEMVDSVRKELRLDEPEYHLHSTSYYYTPVHLPKKVLQGISDRPYGQLVLSLMTQPFVPQAVSHLVPGGAVRETQLDEYGIGDKYAGRIGVIQEQGCKGRIVAQPSAAIQLAFYPLHHVLQGVAQRLYPLESCVTDQSEGAYAMVNHLRGGHDVFSIDLSSATDRFPRTFSQRLLRFLGLGSYADALEEVCLLPWRCAFAPSKEVYYESGQPMGIYGSFPLFHLSNLVLADACARMASRGDTLVPFADGTFFKVLGDDIVLSDPVVARLYGGALEKLGVDISVNKSFQGRVAEFAGFIACPSKGGYTVFRPYKVPDRGFVSNPMDFLHGLGDSVLKLGGRWPERLQAYKDTLPSRHIDLTPLQASESQKFGKTVRLEPWSDSLAEGIGQLLVSVAREQNPLYCTKPLLTTVDWIKECSGYNWLNQSFQSYALTACGQAARVKSRLNDRQFDPATSKSEDKDAKRKEHHLTDRRFAADPLVSSWMAERRSRGDDLDR